MSIKGWCPGLFTPMQSGDGWLVRVQPRRSRLSALDARLIADAAARHGNGIIELTNRGNLQVRGLTPASALLFASEMVAAGLAGANHNIMVSPLAGDDPGVDAQTIPIADALDGLLGGLDGLPDKFLFVIDGGGLPVPADIAARADGGRWGVWVDGEPLGIACQAYAVPEIMLRLARAFAANAAGARRMRQVAGSVLAASGLVADAPAIGRTPSETIGFLPYRGDAGGFGLGIPFGSMTAPTLQHLAEMAERFCDATLRITPWRSVILTGVARAQLENLHGDDLITDPADYRRHIVACTGHPRCAEATVDARADAASLAALRSPGTVHVSGCTKGCAHPGAAPITLVGRNGAYDIVRDGRAADPPERSGLTMPDIARILAGVSAS
jgi:precorrin-3B synthase